MTISKETIDTKYEQQNTYIYCRQTASLQILVANIACLLLDFLTGQSSTKYSYK